MLITLILCTRNRAIDFNFFLKNLIQSTFQDYELIIIDQSDPLIADENYFKLNSYISPQKFKYIRSNLLGLSNGRNLGLSYSNGDIVGFPDDDCWYPSDFLSKIYNYFLDPNLQLLSGYFIDPKISSLRTPNYSTNLNIFNLGKLLSSITFFYRRSSLEDLFFDKNLGVGSNLPFGEENDFAIRIISRGKKCIYSSNIFLYHPEKSKTTPYELAQYTYGYVLGKNCTRFPVFIYSILGFIKIFKYIFTDFKIFLPSLKCRLLGFINGFLKSHNYGNN